MAVRVTLNFILNVLITISTLQANPLMTEEENVLEVGWEDDNKIHELEEKWFEQYLNHFDVFDNRTFPVRYVVENRFFKPGGPLLLEIGGEGGIDLDSLKNGHSYPLAEQLNGKIILVEHRYYGKSVPFENLTVENLKYLSVEQALEDLVNFVLSIKKTTDGLENSKVAVFGCSYAGSLATWMRYKFPHVVDAAWASSAPLRAVADFYEYLEVALEVYSNVSSRCVDVIKNGYNEAKSLLATPEGKKKVMTLMENWACGNITEMDPNTILRNTRFVLLDHNLKPDHGVSSCRLFTTHNKSLTAFEKLASYLKKNSKRICTDPFEDFSDDEIAWTYQTCTEFGYSITSSSRKNPFNDTWNAMDEDLQLCIANFGENYSKELLERGIDRINRVYGNVQLQATKILSVHGTQDPWHKLGLYRSTNVELPVVLIPGGSHCVDQTNNDDEPLTFTKAKIAAQKIMKKWLQQ